MKKTLSILLITVFLFFAFASPAFAQIWDGKYTVTCNESSSAPCTFCDALKVTANVVQFLTQIALSLAALFITMGAILIMISGANEKWYEMGKSSLTNAVIGLFITLGAWLIVNTVINIIAPGDGGILPWTQVSC